jgi:hypothetical protein
MVDNPEVVPDSSTSSGLPVIQKQSGEIQSVAKANQFSNA